MHNRKNRVIELMATDGAELIMMTSIKQACLMAVAAISGTAVFNDAVAAGHVNTSPPQQQREINSLLVTLGVTTLDELENAEIVYNGEAIGSIAYIGIEQRTDTLLAVVDPNLASEAGIRLSTVPLRNLRRIDGRQYTLTVPPDQLQVTRNVERWKSS